MKCKDVMTKDPVCCVSGDSAVKAAQIMKTHDVGPVPVVDNSQDKRIVGLVTDRDLVLGIVAEGLDPNDCKVEDVMSRNLVTCYVDDDLDRAIEAMADNQVRRVPVIDRGRRLTGIIAQADVATRAHEPRKTAEVVEEVSRPGVMRAG